MDAHFKIVCMALGKQENSLAAAAALGPSTALNIRWAASRGSFMFSLQKPLFYMSWVVCMYKKRDNGSSLNVHSLKIKHLPLPFLSFEGVLAVAELVALSLPLTALLVSGPSSERSTYHCIKPEIAQFQSLYWKGFYVTSCARNWRIGTLKGLSDFRLKALWIHFQMHDFFLWNFWFQNLIILAFHKWIKVRSCWLASWWY